MLEVYRKSSRKKSGMSAGAPGRPNRRRGKRKVWQPPWRATMLRGPGHGRRNAARMNQSLLQLIGFVVLAAVVLATGFQAIGAPLAVPGGF